VLQVICRVISRTRGGIKKKNKEIRKENHKEQKGQTTPKTSEIRSDNGPRGGGAKKKFGLNEGGLDKKRGRECEGRNTLSRKAKKTVIGKGLRYHKRINESGIC